MDGQEHRLKDPEGEELRLVPRTVLPKRWVDGTYHWNCMRIQSWKKEEHINGGEMRGGLSILEELVKHGALHDYDFLSITDSRVALAATAKGRSPSFSLLTQLRRRCGMVLATGMHNLGIWVGSELMPMDWYSRNRDYILSWISW